MIINTELKKILVQTCATAPGTLPYVRGEVIECDFIDSRGDTLLFFRNGLPIRSIEFYFNPILFRID